MTAGAFQTTFSGIVDAFVTKLNSTGSALVYSTYLGGSGSDGSSGIAVDTQGNAYVTGVTGSIDFPTTAGAFHTSFGGGDSDAFVTKLNPTGTALVDSTFLGGSGSDQSFGIAVDAAGNAYVAGETASADFPTTTGSFQSTLGGSTDTFVAKIGENQAPTLTSFTPTSGPVGTTVTVTGTAFTGATAVAFNGTSATFTLSSATSISATVPSGATSGTISVTTPGGTATSTTAFTVIPAPPLTGLGDLIGGFGLKPGIADSLLAKVRAAQASLAIGNSTAACHQLQALINQARAQSGKHLTADQATAIITAYQESRPALGCK
jgi:hypothetical protein